MSTGLGLLESLPAAVLILIFHHANVREIFRCQRLSKFFFHFLRHNRKSIQPRKIDDTLLVLWFPLEKFSLGRVKFRTSDEDQQRVRYWRLKFHEDEASLHKAEKKGDVLKTEVKNLYYYREKCTISKNTWQLACCYRSREALQAVVRLMVQRYAICGVHFYQLDENEVDFLGVLPFFEDLKQLSIDNCECDMENVLNALETTYIEDFTLEEGPPMRGLAHFDWKRVLKLPMIHNLRRLVLNCPSVSGIPQFNDAILARLQHRCEKINIAMNTGVTAFGICELVEAWMEEGSRIEELDIRTLDRDIEDYFPGHHECSESCVIDSSGAVHHELRRDADEAILILDVKLEPTYVEVRLRRSQ